MAAPEDRGGVPARRGRLPERLDGGGRAEGAARAPPGVGGRAPSSAATGCPRAGRGWWREGDLAATVVTPSNTGPGARDRRAVAADEAGAAPRGAAGPAVAPAGGPDPAAAAAADGERPRARGSRPEATGGGRRFLTPATSAALESPPRRDGRGLRRRARGGRAGAEAAEEEAGGRPGTAQAEAGRAGPGAGEARRPQARGAARPRRAGRVAVARARRADRPRARALDLAALRAHPRRTRSSSSAARSRSQARWPRRAAGSRPTAATGSSSTAAASSGAPRRPTRAAYEADPVDLTRCLVPGPNVIGVEVLYYGHGDGTWPFGKPGLPLRAARRGVRRARRRGRRDGSWRALLDRAHRPGQFKRWYLRALQEEFDARLRPVRLERARRRARTRPGCRRRCSRSRPTARRRREPLRLPDATAASTAATAGARAAREVPLVPRDASVPVGRLAALGPRRLAPRPARLVRVPDARARSRSSPDRRRRPRATGAWRLRAAPGRGRLRHASSCRSRSSAGRTSRSRRRPARSSS